MMTLSRNDLAKQKILQLIVEKFKENKKYLEAEVNEIIQSFDVDDQVLIRMELVNFGYLGKNSYQGKYWLIKKN